MAVKSTTSVVDECTSQLQGCCFTREINIIRFFICLNRIKEFGYKAEDENHIHEALENAAGITFLVSENKEVWIIDT